jgi:dTDP-glucose 4,6-dehydratase
MKILITGISGFLGKSLQEYFQNNHEVLGWQRGDINLSSVITNYKPDLMLHCAGEIYKIEHMIDTNIMMVYDILNAIKDHSPSTKLIHIGSSAEYGPVDRATSESDRINPVDLYQATKGSGTLLCQAYSRQFGLKTCVARIYSGYGPHERPHRLFPKLYRAFYHDEPMNLFAGEHDFIYIDDFCRAIDILANSEWPAGEIVNLGSGIQHSNLSVLQSWEHVTGKKALVTYQEVLSKPFESKVWCCDTSYARDRYGFITKFSLAEGIQEFINKRKKNVL